jgi:hypothetical protein
VPSVACILAVAWMQIPRTPLGMSCLRGLGEAAVEAELTAVRFFLTEGQGTNRFPAIAGLARDSIVLKTDDDRSTWTMRHLLALGLHQDPFVTEGPSCCSFEQESRHEGVAATVPCDA